MWVGYAQGQVPMLDVHGIKVTGGSFPALIWNGLMTDASSAQPVARNGDAAPDLVLVRLCADTMQLANARCPNVVEMYLPSSQAPTAVCRKH